MEQFVGTPNCPHLGFDLQRGRPCCHADDQTRTECGKFAPNPAALHAAGQFGVEAYFCTVLGKETIPEEALRLGAQQKAAAARQAAPPTPRFKPPAAAHGQEPLPQREQPADAEPVIPTHTLKSEGKQIMPNDRCPCGSGKKYKKCCGR